MGKNEGDSGRPLKVTRARLCRETGECGARSEDDSAAAVMKGIFERAADGDYELPHPQPAEASMVPPAIVAAAAKLAAERGVAGNFNAMAEAIRELWDYPRLQVLARLTAGGQQFWGANGSVDPRLSGLNGFSQTHAEGEVGSQASQAGVNGGGAILEVDTPLCAPCAKPGGVPNLQKLLNLDSLAVKTPKSVLVLGSSSERLGTGFSRTD